MKQSRRALAAAVAAAFLSGCMGTVAQPLPEPTARPMTQVRGVVLGDPDDGERIRYRTVEHVAWTDSTLSVSGIVDGSGGLGSAPVTTTTYRLSEVGAVLVRGLDVNRTSLIVAGVMVGASIAAMLLFGGKTTSQTVF